MFENFTDRARKVMAMANQEAQRFNHEYIGTEHIIIALVKEGSGLGAHVLKNLEIDLRKVRLETEKLTKSGPEMVTMGRLPQTPRARKVLEYANEAAGQIRRKPVIPGTSLVGTEHLLLGLLRETDGIAAQVLLKMGLTFEEVWNEVVTVVKEVDGTDADIEGKPASTANHGQEWSMKLEFVLPAQLDRSEVNRKIAEFLGGLSQRQIELGGTGLTICDGTAFEPVRIEEPICGGGAS